MKQNGCNLAGTSTILFTVKRFLIGIVLISSLSFAMPPMAKESFTMDYDKSTVCLVRHLKVYKDPQWASKINLKNGKKVFFCSPKSMIEFYHQPGKWFDVGVKSEADLVDIVVTDYSTMKPINARKAYYVYGSRAISPAGDDLVPFAKEEDAKNFAKRYSGKRVLKFNEIKSSLIRLINGRI